MDDLLSGAHPAFVEAALLHWSSLKPGHDTRLRRDVVVRDPE